MYTVMNWSNVIFLVRDELYTRLLNNNKCEISNNRLIHIFEI